MPAARNELGRGLYAHSSPVYVEFAGERLFDVEAARALLRRIEEAEADIRGRGPFSSAEARGRLLALYEDAAHELNTRMNRYPR